VRITRGRRFAILATASASVLIGAAFAIAMPSHPQRALAATMHRAPGARLVHAAPPAIVQSAADTEEPAQRFTGKVGTNLTDALIAAGVPEREGREYIAVLGRAIDLRGGLSVDDKFDLIVERLPGGRWGRLLYVGMDRVARSDVELLKWTDGRNIVWINGDGVGGQDSEGMRLPVNGRLTSSFGERFHPILGYVRFHKGVDLAASAGTPIVAAADGRVVSAGWQGGYGRQVSIVHAGGIETTYGHMSQIAAFAGEIVHRGQVIGYVGSTGLSTGPHLHFEVTRNGQPVNPMTAKLVSGPGHLEGEKLEQFDAALRGLLLGSAKSG
jgi:murein DD-endopeptidase MepM/ murein hydrolase activator NlpD